VTTLTRQLKFGDILPNGATVIAFRPTNSFDFVVLAHGDNDFVTWVGQFNQQGKPHTWAGHYFFDDLKEAVLDFEKRR
jgi:hypothetical protein